MTETSLRDMIEDAKTRPSWELNTALINFQMNIRLLRRSKGWTQRQVAEKLDVAHSWVARHETGGSQPSMESLSRYAHILGVSIAELLDEWDTPTPAKAKLNGGSK